MVAQKAVHRDSGSFSAVIMSLAVAKCGSFSRRLKGRTVESITRHETAGLFRPPSLLFIKNSRLALVVTEWGFSLQQQFACVLKLLSSSGLSSAPYTPSLSGLASYLVHFYSLVFLHMLHQWLNLFLPSIKGDCSAARSNF